MKVAAYVPDLMDRSKVAAAAPGATFVARADDLAGIEADLVVLDLTRPGAVDVLPRVQARTVGFCRHTMRDVIAAAEQAGCDRVLARSEFFADVAGALS
ncbi:MAG: hypothetical protein JOZ68_08105 [Acidimicrobiia bacterium]|nr:hypothetical protein [Acidimicrobiia bacterium]MBV9040954.1 hypothetical protein [Acidimicrobiia bacterium]